jgi:hypothetical protein
MKNIKTRLVDLERKFRYQEMMRLENLGDEERERILDERISEIICEAYERSGHTLNGEELKSVLNLLFGMSHKELQELLS